LVFGPVVVWRKEELCGEVRILAIHTPSLPEPTRAVNQETLQAIEHAFELAHRIGGKRQHIHTWRVYKDHGIIYFCSAFSDFKAAERFQRMAQDCLKDQPVALDIL